jgi:hypothetical protein
MSRSYAVDDPSIDERIKQLADERMAVIAHNFTDLTGECFGHWSVIERAAYNSKGGGTKWLCRCVCGAERPVFASTLRRGASRSCGCSGAGKAPKFGRQWVPPEQRDGEYFYLGQRCEVAADHAIGISLSTGDITWIDPDDFTLVASRMWGRSKAKNGHAITGRPIITASGQEERLLHRAILDVGPAALVDHRDLDRLNNRRRNIRVANYCENAQHSVHHPSVSGYRGVSIAHGKYKVAIRAANKLIYIGRFESIVDAAKAYDAAAINLHGEFAILNFPEENRSVAA